MSLRIYLLGQFKLLSATGTIELPSRPAQSILAYLILNAGITHRREKLANLIWPEANESNARSYLRQALWRIRKTIESGSLKWEDYLHISDISVTFIDLSDYWLDADILLGPMDGIPTDEIKEVVRIYKGELLPGFYDEWVLLERDRLSSAYHQKMNLLLEALIHQGQWDETLEWGEQWIRLGHAPEPAYRALMKAYAGLGDQGMVSAVYQRCVEAVDRDLGLDPSAETKLLYEQILRGELVDEEPPKVSYADQPVQQPAFLEQEEPTHVEKQLFVAREPELAQLEKHLNLSIAGQGKVVFITGEAGSGKTALINEFTLRAQESCSELIVSNGNCNAHTGIGDPYLPFREVLELLSGDVEPHWAAGAISRDHCLRLWNILPVTTGALVEYGPDLIDAFVPGTALIQHAKTCNHVDRNLFSRLEKQVARQQKDPTSQNPHQRFLFEQYTKVLQALSTKAPLLIVLDDLQWADLGSISLLFHLGRHIAHNRILILGAFRPEEVTLGREGDRHPLEPVVNEFLRQFGDIIINVSKADGREFVEAILDSAPNHLGNQFGNMLFQQTHGHPLFTVELLRGMQERGDLVQDNDGYWIEGPSIDWETMPARVEAVIAERIDRLDQNLRNALQVASVEGETFTAEVVARALDTDNRVMVRRFSSELDRKHRLLHASSIMSLGSQNLSRYRFRHYLCQKYLYDNLDKAERAYLHEDVGSALENLYSDHIKEISTIAPHLARHFKEANNVEKAIHYLHIAGEKSLQLNAYEEARAHLNDALTLLMARPESQARMEKELSLQILLGTAWIGIESNASPLVEAIYARARLLCQQVGTTTQHCRVIGQLAIIHYVRAEFEDALKLSQEMINLAESAGDPIIIVMGNWLENIVLFCQGEFTNARKRFGEVLDFYQPEQHHKQFLYLRGSDAGVSALAYDACCLFCLGYPDQAQSRSIEALTLARELGHPFSLADVLCFAGCLFNSMRRKAGSLKEYGEELEQLSDEKLQGWRGTGTCYHGEGLAMMGYHGQGIKLMRQGLAVRESTNVRCYSSGTIGSLAEALANSGKPEDGLKTLAEGLSMIEETGERHLEAELYRIQAEIFLVLKEETKAEASLNKAVEVARKQNAKMWELRAATDLARLWSKQGKELQARRLLGEIYNWFTEGFDTPDLIKAKLLLDEMK